MWLLLIVAHSCPPLLKDGLNVRESFLHALIRGTNNLALRLRLARGRRRSEKGPAASGPAAGGVREGQGVHQPLGGRAECRRRRCSYSQAAGEEAQIRRGDSAEGKEWPPCDKRLLVVKVIKVKFVNHISVGGNLLSAKVVGPFLSINDSLTS